MGLFGNLKSMMSWVASAPQRYFVPREISTRRPLPSTEERIPERPGGPSARFFFLPYPDSPYSDTTEIKAAMRLMLRDPYVKSAWLSNVLTVASQDFQVHASDDNDPLAKQQADFLQRTYEGAEGGMVGIATAILNPLGSDGYSLAEKVWTLDQDGIDKGRIKLRKLKPKRPDKVWLHGDQFNNVTGVRSILNQHMWPISDFVYCRYMPVYDEIDGIAPFRASYAAYWMHDTVRKLRIIHHEKKIGGMLVGTYTDPNDKPGLEDALARAKSATWMAIPEGVRIQAQQLSLASDSEYAEFVADCRTDIVTGITFASLQILEGQTPDARGDSKVQKAISDLAPWYLTYILTECINRQLTPDLIDFNFPRVPIEYPKVTFGAVSNQELLQLCDLLSRAQQLGLKPSKKYYARMLTIQEADPLDPSDAMAAPGQGGMPGMPGMMGLPGMDPSQMGQQLPQGPGGMPFGGGALPAPAPFGGPPPMSDPAGMDPMAQQGQPEGLFSERNSWDSFAASDWTRLPNGSWRSPGGRVLSDPKFRELIVGADAKKKAEPPISGETPEPGTEPAPATASPQHVLALAIAERIRSGQTITAKQLFEAANKVYGGSRAAGTYGPADAYDALEAGFNMAMLGKTDPTLDTAEAIAQARRIATSVSQLPTQTNRSGNKESFQQFSTPAHLSYAVSWLANIKPGDTVLEPSAGTGSIAIHAKNAGATVYGNELDPKRAALLEALLGSGQISKENAEQIGAILKSRVNPSVVVMNPPFSQTAGRLGDKKDVMVAAKHIDEALSLLPEGGRLVAVVGEGMRPDAPRYAPWFRALAAQYDLRANMGVPGSEYTKSGTSFGTRVLVIDKRPSTGNTVTGDAKDIPDLMEKLANVRNDRSEPVGDGLASPGVAHNAGAAGLAARATAATLAGRPAQSGVVVGEGASVPTGPAPAGQINGDAGGRLGTATGRRGSGRGAGKPGNGDDGAGAGASGRTAGGKLPGKPSGQVPQLRPASPVETEPGRAANKSDAGSQADLGESTFVTWQPNMRVKGGQPLPANIVESAAMGAVPAPQVDYKPHLSPDIIEKGMLSETALETLIYAGAAHSKMLPASENMVRGEMERIPERRRGYFLGDGTGVGKGRQIAGVITDNINQGRPKHVWVSKTWDLFHDAQRDWKALGHDPKTMLRFDKLRKMKDMPQSGVAYITYGTLKSKPTAKAGPDKLSSLETLVKWLGPDYDGVIAFDEAHMMANATTTKGSRGDKKPSATALAGLELQRRLPKARVLYVSATGATELSNLAYADRLGLWGGGTAFPTRESFMQELDKGGVAAMEAVAQSLKATGQYSARTISLGADLKPGDPQQVKYDRLAHVLTPEQKSQYDAAAEAWQTVLKNIDKALEVAGAKDSKHARNAARSQFWGAQQRFFNQLMTSMQTPSVINEMEKDLKEGRSPVVQLTSTGEAALKRAMAEKEEDQDFDDLDVSPRKILQEYLEKSFPIHRYQEVLDEDGNTHHKIVTDSNGVPVEDPTAVAMRDEMMHKVSLLKIPEGPLDSIISHFGVDQVAEATGRTERVVPKMQPNGRFKPLPERRNPRVANIAETADFQAGRKKIMVFSDAGATGRSYHADRDAANQQQRVHYLLQPGWRADTAVQGLGRTHRANQVSAPLYRLVQIDQLKGQKRFVSTIARRLDQLGALTKGQREAGSGGLFGAGDNLESRQASEAMNRFFSDLRRGSIESLPYRDTMEKLGFAIPEDDRSGRGKFDPPPVTQFLNRLLSLKVDDQAAVFDEFENRLTEANEAAIRNNTLDVGLANYPAERITPVTSQVIYKDPDTGADVTLHTVEVQNKTRRIPFDKAKAPRGYYRNKQSGQIWAGAPALDFTDPKTGTVTSRTKLVGPQGGPGQVVPSWQLDNGSYYGSNWTPVTPEEARSIWQEQYDKTPEVSTTNAHFMSGALLRVWDRLPKVDQPRIYRVKPDGKPAIVGREIPGGLLPKMLKDFGVESEGHRREYKPHEVHAAILAGDRATLTGGWKLKRALVQNERRIELTGVTPYDMRAVENAGAIREKIGWDTRYFIPTGPAGVEVLRKIAAMKPVVEIQDRDSFGEQPSSALATMTAIIQARGNYAGNVGRRRHRT